MTGGFTFIGCMRSAVSYNVVNKFHFIKFCKLCRVLEVAVLVDDDCEDADLENKNLEGRAPMSRTSRTMSSRSKSLEDRV